MRRIVLIFTLGFIMIALCAAQAQHYVGVRAGYGSGSIRLFPKAETSMVWGLYSGGVSYKYYSDVKYVGAVQIDMQLLQKGFNWLTVDTRTPDDTTTTYSRTVNSIDLPLMWQPHFYLFNRSMRIFLNLGLVFSYNINSTYKWASPERGVYDSGTYEMQTPRDNRWGYGLCGGAGLSVFIRRFELAVEGRYYYGYSDILRNKNKYADNPIRSPLDNINISMALYYRLNKEGLRSAPSKRVAEKIAKRERESILDASSSKIEHGSVKIREQDSVSKIEIKERLKDGNDKTTESSKTDTKGH